MTTPSSFAARMLEAVTARTASGEFRWTATERRAAVAYVLLPLLPEMKDALPEALERVLGQFLVEHGITSTTPETSMPEAIEHALEANVPDALRRELDAIVGTAFDEATASRLDNGRRSAERIGVNVAHTLDQSAPQDGAVAADPLARFRLSQTAPDSEE